MKRLLILATVIVTCLALLVTAQPATAQNGNQWRVDYYPNLDWAGYPVATYSTGLVAFNWGTNPPAYGMPAQDWTARMTTDAFFYAGLYRFTVQADDEVALFIDGVTYLDTRGQGQSGKTFTIDIPLNQNYHRVQVDFRQFSGTAYLYVTWTYDKATAPPVSTPLPPPPPSGSQPAPGTVPMPSPSSVVTQYGDYTPCIQQNLHQSQCFQSNGAWDSPNMGSIETEPKIVLWGNCVGDSIQTIQLYQNTPPQSAKCSKTEAGWFAN
jgi:hypothetical protein